MICKDVPAVFMQKTCVSVVLKVLVCSPWSVLQLSDLYTHIHTKTLFVKAQFGNTPDFHQQVNGLTSISI